MSVPNFMAIHPIVVEIFQSSNRPANQQTDQQRHPWCLKIFWCTESDSLQECGFFPPFKCSEVLSVSISSDYHIRSFSREMWYVVNIKPCRTDDIAAFSCPFIPSLGLQSKCLFLIITLLKPFHSGDEHPLQTVNKQVGCFHEASSQNLIAPQNWPLPTVNSNYCTHGFLSLSYI